MKPLSLLQRTGCYGLVGAICAVANNAIMILGDFAGLHYALMLVLSFMIVVPLGYLLQSAFTFRVPASLNSFLRFTSVVVLGFPLALLTMAVLCSGFGLRAAIAAPGATVALVIWNYASAYWAIAGRTRLQALAGARTVR